MLLGPTKPKARNKLAHLRTICINPIRYKDPENIRRYTDILASALGNAAKGDCAYALQTKTIHLVECCEVIKAFLQSGAMDGCMPCVYAVAFVACA